MAGDPLSAAPGCLRAGPDELGDDRERDGGLAGDRPRLEHDAAGVADPPTTASASRVLPTPASPSTSRSASVRSRRHAIAAISRATSASRPTSGSARVSPTSSAIDGAAASAQAWTGRQVGLGGRRVGTEPAVADGLRQVGRLRQRGDAQLPIEGAHEIPVLGEGAGDLPRSSERRDHQLVGGLVERVDLDPAPCRLGRQVPSSLGGTRTREALEGAGQIPSMGLALGRLPLVEGLAVAEREALHERAPIPCQRLVEGGDAVDTGVRRRVAVAARPRQRRAEAPEVRLDRPLLEGDRRAIDDQAPPTQPRTEDRERAPEGVPGVGPVGLRPEEGGQRLAARRAPHHREVGQQRDRLARVEGDRAAIDRDLDRAEEPDRDAGEVGLHVATIPDGACGP